MKRIPFQITTNAMKGGETMEEDLEEDLVLEKGTHVIRKEDLPKKDQEELEKLIEETGNELSADDIPDELQPELPEEEEEKLKEELGL